MNYLALIYTTPEDSPAIGSPEWETLIGEYQAMEERFRADGITFSGNELQPASTATTITVRDGKVSTMDGPFAVTKEELGGYYLFDVPDLDTALRYAAMIPSAATGRVEVRPVVEFED
ncbi:MAG: YciI family protein [Pseudomonadota bacterium]